MGRDHDWRADVDIQGQGRGRIVKQTCLCVSNPLMQHGPMVRGESFNTSVSHGARWGIPEENREPFIGIVGSVRKRQGRGVDGGHMFTVILPMARPLNCFPT